MRNRTGRNVATGGVMAALATVILCLGGMIPASTYVCPMLCMLILRFVRGYCTEQIAWAWYAVVALLAVLLGPDKEAAAVFAFLGYYPILKPKLEGMKLGWLWKAVLFNTATLVMYWLLIHLFGMTELAEEFRDAGTILLAVLLVLGNAVFFLTDLLLGMKPKRRKG